MKFSFFSWKNESEIFAAFGKSCQTDLKTCDRQGIFLKEHYFAMDDKVDSGNGDNSWLYSNKWKGLKDSFLRLSGTKK